MEGLLCMSGSTVVLQTLQETMKTCLQVNSPYLMFPGHAAFTGHALERTTLYNTSSCQWPSCWMYTNSKPVSKVLF